MSDYIPHRVARTEIPIGESEPLTAYPIYGPGANKFYAPTRVQAERLAEELNRLMVEIGQLRESIAKP